MNVNFQLKNRIRMIIAMIWLEINKEKSHPNVLLTAECERETGSDWTTTTTTNEKTVSLIISRMEMCVIYFILIRILLVACVTLSCYASYFAFVIDWTGIELHTRKNKGKKKKEERKKEFNQFELEWKLKHENERKKKQN